MRQLLGLGLLIAGIYWLGIAFQWWTPLPTTFIVNLWPLLLVLLGLLLLTNDGLWVIVGLLGLVVGLMMLNVFAPSVFVRLETTSTGFFHRAEQVPVIHLSPDESASPTPLQSSSPQPTSPLWPLLFPNQSRLNQ